MESPANRSAQNVPELISLVPCIVGALLTFLGAVRISLTARPWYLVAFGIVVVVAASVFPAVVADTFVIVSVVLMVLGGLAMTSAIRPVILIILGAVLILAPLVGPSIVDQISPNTKIDAQTRSSFLFFSMVEFIGACFLGAGLGRLCSHKRRGLSSVEALRKN